MISEQQRIGRRSTPYISHLLLQIQSKAVLVSYEIQSFCPFRDQDDNIFSIDATYESGRYGPLLNHSKLNPNCLTKSVIFADIPCRITSSVPVQLRTEISLIITR